MDIRTGLVAALLAWGIPSFANAEHKEVKGSVELSVGNQTATLDSKLAIDPPNRFNMSLRNRTTSDYKGDKNNFLYLSLHFEPFKGMSVGGGIRETTFEGLRPHVAGQYKRKDGGISVSQLISLTMSQDPQLMTLTNLTHLPEINRDWKFMTELELVFFIGKEGYQSSIQRLRFGPRYKRVQFGFAIDTMQKKDSSFSSNVGLGVKAYL
jgi:hypothetical protein